MTGGGAERLPVYSDGIGRESIYPGAVLTREQARQAGNRLMPRDLKRAGFVTHVFRSDLEIHGAAYFRVTYGRDY